MKHFIAPRSPAPAADLAWAAPAAAPVRAASTTPALHAVLRRVHAPQQLNLPFQARSRA